MHEITGQVHWHEPSRLQARRLRQVQPAEDALRPVHGIRRHSGLPRHRRQQGAEPAAAPWRRMGGRGSYIQLHGTEGKWGCLRRRGAGRRRAQRRKAHLRGDLSRRRRPRLDRGLARRRQQAPRLRMAEGLAVLDSGQRHAPHRQCQLGAGAAARRHHRAQPDEPHQQRRRDLRLPAISSATASPAPTISTNTRTTSSPIRCAASPCGAPISFPTSSIAICRSTTAARPAIAASSRS